MSASESDDGSRTESDPAVRRWFLLDGSRTVVAGITAALVFLIVALVTRSSLVPLGDVQPLFYLFSSLLGGNITLITVVVSINQLLLSQELSTPGDLRSQMGSVIDYRRDVESGADQVSPAEPEEFLRFLYEGLDETARSLGDQDATALTPDVRDRLDTVVADLRERAQREEELLGESEASTFEVLSATLTTNYGREIVDLRRVKSEADGLDDEVTDAIDDVVERLENIDVARQYFKSVYVKEELASLSRILFYVGLPSLVAVGIGLLFLTASDGAAISESQLTIVVPILFTVGLLPICFLFAFVVRVATVTRRTAAKIPFTTPD